MSLGQQLAPHLPFLRRFARALYGDQDLGDAAVRTTLDRIAGNASEFPRDVEPRLALYGWFLEEVGRRESKPWPKSSGASVEAEHIAGRRLAAMSSSARLALLLTTMEGFTPKDAGHLLGMSARQVDRRVNEALREIKRQTHATVLIIEDEAIMAMELESIVRDLGHEVVGVATTRSEAVTLARATKPRLILADVALKDDSSGIDAVNDILAEMWPSVIFVTGFPERLLTGDRAKPTILVTKPFRHATMKAAISQALFFDGDFGARDAQETDSSTHDDISSRTKRSAADRAIVAVSSDLALADVDQLEAPVHVEVQGGRIVATPGPTSAATIGSEGVETLRRQHHETVTRLATALDGANLGIPFGVRLRSIERTLATPLDDPDFIALGVQVRGLRTMTAAIRDQLADDRAADVAVFIQDVGDFAWTSKAYRSFVAEADRAEPLGKEGRAALIHVARTIEAQDDAIVASDLRTEIAAARINAQDDVEPEAEFALRRVLGNVLRAATRFARARVNGTAAHLWPSFDKELGERMGKTLSWIPIAGVSTLLLAQLLPAEFGAAGLLTKLVKLLLD